MSAEHTARFEDEPGPGGGYLLFIHAIVWVCLLLPWVILLSVGDFHPVALLAVAHSTVVLVLVYWMLLHAAYRTSYRIADGKLLVRSGMFSSVIHSSGIRGIDRVRFLRRTLGWGIGCRGYCNRFRDGIKLQLKKDAVYLSPSNPALFIETLRGLAPGEGRR